jgi:hypothetical protein
MLDGEWKKPQLNIAPRSHGNMHWSWMDFIRNVVGGV